MSVPDFQKMAQDAQIAAAVGARPQQVALAIDPQAVSQAIIEVGRAGIAAQFKLADPSLSDEDAACKALDILHTFGHVIPVWQERKKEASVDSTNG
jgi:hypothetical protein